MEPGWYLDLPGSFAAAAQLPKLFDGVGGAHGRAALIEACFKNPEEVLARLNTAVRQMRRSATRDGSFESLEVTSPWPLRTAALLPRWPFHGIKWCGSQVTLLPEALVQPRGL